MTESTTSSWLFTPESSQYVLNGHIKPYCRICGAPTTKYCHNADAEVLDSARRTPSSAATPFESLPGLNRDDAQWLQSCVVIYADCISPPGEYDLSTYCLKVTDSSSHAEADSTEETDLFPTPPPWVLDTPVGCGYFSCSPIDDPLLAHTTCIYLAATWSKLTFPKRFLDPIPAPSTSSDPSSLLASNINFPDPVKFFWDAEGPIPPFFCDERVTFPDFKTSEFRTTSQNIKELLGNPPLLYVADFWSTFKHGYDDNDLVESAWLAGRGHAYEHKTEYGITHLKRPDMFPHVYPLDVENTFFDPHDYQNLFNADLPPEILLHILSFFEFGVVVRSLECASKTWLRFFCSPITQPFWRKRNIDVGHVPTHVDWTKSADNVRRKLEGVVLDDQDNAGSNGSTIWDWRRYYNDCRNSPNINNRMRIVDAVNNLDHSFGNCECPRVVDPQELEGTPTTTTLEAATDQNRVTMIQNVQWPNDLPLPLGVVPVGEIRT